MAINLQIVFLMRFFLGFSLNLRRTHFGRAIEMRFLHQSYRPFPTPRLFPVSICARL